LERVERLLVEKYGGEDYVFDQLASGRSVGDVAGDLGISRRYLYYWRDRLGHKERRKPLWEEAIRFAGEAHAERGMAELDGLGVDVNSPQVQLATSKSNFRKWLAAKSDPERYGDKAAGITFNLGDLHIQALQQPRDVPVIEAEVVEVLEGGSSEQEDDAQTSEQQLLPPSPSTDSHDELWELL
jgi:hypothetical protein